MQLTYLAIIASLEKSQKVLQCGNSSQNSVTVPDEIKLYLYLNGKKCQILSSQACIHSGINQHKDLTPSCIYKSHELKINIRFVKCMELYVPHHVTIIVRPKNVLIE